MDLITKSPGEYFESLCIFQQILLNELSLNFLRSSSFFYKYKTSNKVVINILSDDFFYFENRTIIFISRDINVWLTLLVAVNH